MRRPALLLPLLLATACGGPADESALDPLPALEEGSTNGPGTPAETPPETAPDGGTTIPPAPPEADAPGAGEIPEAPDARPSTPDAGSSDPDSGEAAPTLPSQILDLTAWKVTLPVADGSDNSPREVKQPALEAFSLAPYFQVSETGNAVVFRAPAGGFTTSNSSYPRSELREMTADGRDLASWSTTEGIHTLLLRQTITAQPVVKPHVVAGQIHDAEDDVLMIRLEGERLFVERDGDEVGLLDPSYVLGTPMTVKLVARNGQIAVFYNDLTTPKVRVTVDANGCYFKAGAYTQSNTSKGDAPDAAGEVVIETLELSHE